MLQCSAAGGRPSSPAPPGPGLGPPRQLGGGGGRRPYVPGGRVAGEGGTLVRYRRNASGTEVSGTHPGSVPSVGRLLPVLLMAFGIGSSSSRNAPLAPAPGAGSSSKGSSRGTSKGNTPKAGAAAARRPAKRGRRAELLGVHATARRVRVACLDASSTEPVVTRLIDRPLPPQIIQAGKVMDRGVLTDELRALVDEERLMRSRAVLAVPVMGGSLTLKRLLMPRATPEEARAQAPGLPQVRSLVVDADNTMIELAVLDPEGTSPQMPALVVVAKREAIEPRQVAAIEAGLVVDAVDVDALAVYNCIQRVHEAEVEAGAAILHIGDEGSLILVVDARGPVLARHVTVGLDTLVEDVLNGAAQGADPSAEAGVRTTLLGHTPHSDPMLVYQDAITTWHARLAEQVRTTISSVRGTPPGTLFVCGEGAVIPGLAESMRADYDANVLVFNPLDGLRVDAGAEPATPLEGTAYTLALGLALRQLES